MHQFKHLVAALALVAISATAGLAQSQEQAEPELSDRWITTKVQASYFMDEDVKARAIDVRTVNGVVTLTGVVGSEREREQAVQIARTVDGVKQVVDRLRMGTEAELGASPGETPEGRPGEQTPGEAEVEDLTQSDAALLTRVKTKLALDGEVSALAIDVDVDDGVVTLSGTVDSETARQRAVTLAGGVDGVKDVQDRLRVGSGANR